MKSHYNTIIMSAYQTKRGNHKKLNSYLPLNIGIDNEYFQVYAMEDQEYNLLTDIRESKWIDKSCTHIQVNRYIC